MPEHEFVAYVGDPDFHDGFISRVSVEANKVEVVVSGYSGREHTVSFNGVKEVKLNSPVDMELYALTEFRDQEPLRKFVFSNSDDDDPRFLHVTATDFFVHSG